MKQFLLGLLIILLIGAISFFFWNKKNISLVTPSFKNVISPTMQVENKKETDIFVPYWTITNNPLQIQKYDKIIYFGITASHNGINTSDDGYTHIQPFVAQTQGKQTILCITLTNQDFNDSLLENKQLQQKIINESISIAKENSFSGILLNFEFNALGFEQVIKNINDFYQLASSSIKKDNLSFYTTVYGDTFYRSRPYDIKKIASLSDSIFVMAYDLHKANGDPGPNFPLNSEDYDIKKMTEDFLQKISASKLVIVFGMYGYDWKVTDNASSIGKGTAITDSEVIAKFYPNCPFDDCKIKNDSISAETNILYSVKNQKHSLWFETLGSVNKKQQYLFSKNVTSTAFWAYSYF